MSRVAPYAPRLSSTTFYRSSLRDRTIKRYSLASRGRVSRPPLVHCFVVHPWEAYFWVVHWLLAYSYVRNEYLRVPFPCSGLYPWHGELKMHARVNRRRVQRAFGRRGPKVQLVSGTPASEAAKRLLTQIRGKRPAVCRMRPMHWTGPTDLIAGLLPCDKAEQRQHLSHRDLRANRRKIDTRHGISPRIREEEPVRPGLILRGFPIQVRLNRMNQKSTLPPDEPVLS